MEETGIISKHIIVFDAPLPIDLISPQSGIILIKGSIIFDLILVSTPEDYEALKTKYSDWNLIDYSDYYISPGLIDLNTRTEWEDLSTLSLRALHSGVTTIVVENGYYNTSTSSHVVHCNVYRALTLVESISLETLTSNQIVLKAYLFPPCKNIKSTSNVQEMLNLSTKHKIPLFVDVNLPDPRMVFMASPLRLSEVSERKSKEDVHNFAYFASAFSQEIQLSDEEENALGEDLPLEKKEEKVKMNPKINNLVQKALSANKKLVNLEGKEEVKFESLNKKINELKLNNEDLFRAEASTYSYASINPSDQNPRKSSEIQPIVVNSPLKSKLSLIPLTNIIADSTPSPPSSLMIRRRQKQNSITVAPVNTSKTPQSDSSNYNHFLANFPIEWETNGVTRIIDLSTPDSQIHFCGVSSAATFNLIRKAKKRSEKITSEIPSVHLSFSSSNIGVGETIFKNTPPIRNPSNNSLLWELLNARAIDVITSGHAYIDPNMKTTESFQTALNGISSLGCTLQSHWSSLNKPGISRQALESKMLKMFELLSFNPAKVLGIEGLRGSIGKGKVADLIVWDPWERFTLKESYWYYTTTPYKNFPLMGRVKQVYFEGKASLVD